MTNRTYNELQEFAEIIARENPGHDFIKFAEIFADRVAYGTDEWPTSGETEYAWNRYQAEQLIYRRQ